MRFIAKKMNMIQHDYNRSILVIAGASRNVAEQVVKILDPSLKGTLNDNIRSLRGRQDVPLMLPNALDVLREEGNTLAAHQDLQAQYHTKVRDE